MQIELDNLQDIKNKVANMSETQKLEIFKNVFRRFNAMEKMNETCDLDANRLGDGQR